MATITKDKTDNLAFIENDCTIKFNNHEFTSGGSYILKRKDNGKYQGIMYADVKNKQVTSWDSSIKIPAIFGSVFNSNFYNNKRQYCWFTYQGINFIGINYSVDWQDCITVKQIK